MGITELADVSEVFLVVIVVHIVVVATCSLLRLLFVSRLPEVAVCLHGHLVCFVGLL